MLELEPPPQATKKERRNKSRIPVHFFPALFNSGKANNHSPGTINPAANIWPSAGMTLDKAAPLIVSVALPFVVVEFRASEEGDMAQVMFVVLAGTAQDKLTVPVNPFVPPTVTIEEPLPPTDTVNAKGFALTLKAGVGTKPGHAVTRLKASNEPRPVAWS